MNIKKEIKHGDIYGVGLAKVEFLHDAGIRTYADIDKMKDLDIYKLPGFGHEVIHKLKDYVQTLKECDKAEGKRSRDMPKVGDLNFFAGLAMQGILAAGIITSTDEVADDAIAYAKELMSKLEKNC